MVQDISYVCVGKGIRKCCSADSIDDLFCTNTETLYHNVILSSHDEFSDNSLEFQGKNADFLKTKLRPSELKALQEKQAAAQVSDDDEKNPEDDLDQDTILKNQTFQEISFDKSQLLKRNGPLVHPNNVLCSDTLKEEVSYYAQFELAPTFKEVCGERYINGSFVE